MHIKITAKLERFTRQSRCGGVVKTAMDVSVVLNFYIELKFGIILKVNLVL